MSSVPRVFLSYAAKDANYRSILLAATKAARLPVQFVEMPNHVTDLRSRRVLARGLLQQCDVALMFLSAHAQRSPLLDADRECVQDADVPLHVVIAGPPRGVFRVPLEWRPASVLTWSWPHIARFLAQPGAAAPVALAAG